MIGANKKANVARLVCYLRSLPNFVMVEVRGATYSHMGALISDAVLQPGVRYDTVVRPRIARILRIFGEFKTTTQFLQALDIHGEAYVLNWTHPEKPRRLRAVTSLLKANGVNTHAGLAWWLQRDDARAILLGQRGVGPKTFDYLAALAGVETVAVDRHIRQTFQSAGLGSLDYDEIREILCTAADTMGISRRSLDHSIWRYQSRVQQDLGF